jgi:hypothetical protein
MTTKRWIVNAGERTVRDANERDILAAGEFIWTGTYADAMAAGARRQLAEEALSLVPNQTWARGAFSVMGDRIEAQAERISDVSENLHDMAGMLGHLRFDVWREGSGIGVLGRL